MQLMCRVRSPRVGAACALAVAASVVLAGPRSGAPPDARAERWREDLHILATELPRRHKEPFFKLARRDFEAAVARLRDEIPGLEDHGIVVGLQRIVALLGDGHTAVGWPEGDARFSRFPLQLFWFDDGLFVTATDPEHERLLRLRVLRIGDSTAEEAAAAVGALTARENESQIKDDVPGLLVVPEILHALRILPDRQRGRFVFEDPQGETLSLELEPSNREGKPSWITAYDGISPRPLRLKHREVDYGYEYLAESRTLFLQYNHCRNTDGRPFRGFVEELLAFADRTPVDRVVIDLRYNPGGNSAVMAPLLKGLERRPALNRRGKLFVLIGRRTYSSAELNAVQLRNRLDAILVGEPTGQKPNAFGEVRKFFLPNSGLKVTYSTRYFKLEPDDPPSLMPAVVIALRSADHFAGRDPVLDAALAYHGDPPSIDSERVGRSHPF